MAGNSSELWRAAWMPLACIAGVCPMAAGRDRNGERGIRVCSCPQLCLCLQKSLHWSKIPGFFPYPAIGWMCSLAWMSQISEHTPLWLRWDWPGWANCFEIQVGASCLSVPSSITAFQVTFQSETLPKGGERKPPLTRVVHRDPANRWCLHRGYSVRVQLHYNALRF